MRAWAPALAALALVASCSSGSSTPSGADDSGDGAQPEPAAASDQATDENAAADGSEVSPHPSDYIFDQDRLHTFELTIPEGGLAAIDADPTAEEYVEGALTFEGQTIEPVGIRYKGSVGAWIFCVAGSDVLAPDGEKICTKLSMKVKINWDDPNDDFFGLRRLQFHSQNLDPTQMHERLGYWLFREMGVPAPRSVHARLVVNGEYVGLFALTEQIDGRFTRYNFADGTGNLYKEVWPLTSDGDPPDDAMLRDALRTNEDEDPSFDRMRDFAADIRDDGPGAVERWMDVDEIMAYVAVDRTIRNDDGAFHWYCFGASCAPHNFYWYEDPEAGRFHLIPWDLDNAFENILVEDNPITRIVDKWGETTADCEPFAYGGFGFFQRSAACDPLVAALATLDSEYEAARAALMSGPFSEERVNAQLDTWSAQIAAATAEAAASHDDALKVTEWEQALEEFRRDLEYARRP